MYEELKKNAFGCIVDIKGDIGNILLMLNNPCNYKDLNDGTMNSNSTSMIRTEFRKGCVTLYTASDDTVFCISLSNKIFLYDNTVRIITSPEGAYLSEVVLVFQGMDKLEETKNIIRDIHGLEVVELVANVHAYSNFDRMIELFNQKQLQDKTLTAM